MSQEPSAEQPPAPLANGPPTTSTVPRTVQTAYPTAPYPAAPYSTAPYSTAPASQRPYSQFPYVK